MEGTHMTRNLLMTKMRQGGSTFVVMFFASRSTSLFLLQHLAVVHSCLPCKCRGDLPFPEIMLGWISQFLIIQWLISDHLNTEQCSYFYWDLLVYFTPIIEVLYSRHCCSCMLLLLELLVTHQPLSIVNLKEVIGYVLPDSHCLFHFRMMLFRFFSIN